jgi:hypothetical protein
MSKPIRARKTTKFQKTNPRLGTSDKVLSTRIRFTPQAKSVSLFS